MLNVTPASGLHKDMSTATFVPDHYCNSMPTNIIADHMTYSQPDTSKLVRWRDFKPRVAHWCALNQNVVTQFCFVQSYYTHTTFCTLLVPLTTWTKSSPAGWQRHWGLGATLLSSNLFANLHVSWSYHGSNRVGQAWRLAYRVLQAPLTIAMAEPCG